MKNQGPSLGTGNRSIALGSVSRLKSLALFQALADLGVADIRCYAENVPSGQDAQPVGLKAIIRGAWQRARLAQRIHEGSIGVGIENGIELCGVYPEDVDLTIEYAAVVGLLPSGAHFISTSQGILFPPEDVLVVTRTGLGTTTVGSVIASRLCCDPEDPHKALTGGQVTRQGLLVEPLKLVLYQAIKAYDAP